MKHFMILLLSYSSAYICDHCTSKSLCSSPLYANSHTYCHEPGTSRNLVGNDMRFRPGRDLSSRSAVTEEEFLWPKKSGLVRVPYFIDINNAYLRNQVTLGLASAAKDLNELTCIRLQEISRGSAGSGDNTDHIRIIDGDGCYSFVGNAGGEQTVSLSHGCFIKGNILHEVMHSLGFLHEQNRPDRDSHVVVRRENVIPDNFVKATESDTLGIPYDYSSVMHYGPDYFTKNGGHTIEVVSSHPDKKRFRLMKIMGQREQLSSLDVRRINKLYNCDVSNVAEKTAELTYPSSLTQNIITDEPQSNSAGNYLSFLNHLLKNVFG